MSLLRSLFSFRQQGHADGDVEKPFLDHLEDLRVTLMKMGSVLMLAMILAFCFRNQLTRLLEKPLEAVKQSELANAKSPDEPRTLKEREIQNFSSLAVSATAKVLAKVLTPEDLKRLTPEDLKSVATAVFLEQREALAKQSTTEKKSALDPAALQTLDVTESFSIALKLSFYAGIVIAFPFLLYFLIGFVLPALTRKEKRLLLPGILGGSILFGFGVWICFVYILPKTLLWFHRFNEDLGFVANWKAGTYFGFVTHLCLACGFLCELPLIMIVLSLLNIISFDLLKRTRRYAVAIILILVAIISPTPDPMTFITLAIPMLAIFEGSIWLVWLIERKRQNNPEE
jgi:sec-independent protein translocase protein TatC